MKRAKSYCGIVFVVALGAALLGTAETAFPGDAVVARTLLESGKKAFTAKKYDDALPLFKKALAEDPTLIESVYWRAQVHEKAKDNVSALAAYREFLDLYAKKPGPSAEDQKLKPLAEKRIEALAVADREFRKLEEKYIADLLAIAKAKVAGDPGAALGAVSRILEIQPKHAEALALREALGVKKESPFAGVASWRDLVKGQEYHSDAISYTDGVMILERSGPGRLRSEPPAPMGAEHAGEMEFRLPVVSDPKWIIGFSIGETKDGSYGAVIEKGQVRVFFSRPKQQPVLISSRATPPLDLTTWHRLGYAVHGARIQVYLDNEMLIDEAQGERVDFAGECGVWLAYCKAEFRMIRLGEVK